MDSRILTALIIIVAAALIGVGVWIYQRRRTDRLRHQFGPEYQRTLRESADRRLAEAELEARARRVESLHIRELDAGDRERFALAWRSVQTRFVDDPRAAVVEADRLVGETMQARGYPLGDFEQCAADISVHHADVVDAYRRAHEIAQRAEREQTTTEELRQATMCYRTLFDELLDDRRSRREARHGRAA
jgi:hypothetical protein